MWGVYSPLIFMNISNISKFFSICLILIVFAFLVNNYLTFAGDWPGAFTIYNSANIYSSTQFFLYVLAIIFPIISDFGFDIFELSMIILSIGSGSMMISHVNDSYFWIVTKQTKFNLIDGLKYFSIISIAQSFGTFLFIILLVTLKSL